MAVERFIWIIRKGELKLYKRIGECNRCGECCGPPIRRYHVAIGVVGSEPKCDYDWSKYEGWAIENWDDPKIAKWWSPTEFPDEISEIRPTCFDESAKICLAIDWPTRPEICCKFPLRPEDIEQYEKCSYRFEEVKDA